MATSKEIREQRALILKESRKLLDANPKGMSGETQEQFDKIIGDADVMQEQISNLERQEKQTKLEQELAEPTPKPSTRTFPHRLGNPGNEEIERKAFDAWFVHACAGKLSGHGLQREDFANMEQYFPATDKMEIRFSQSDWQASQKGEKRTGLSTLANSAGGYLVPTLWRQSVLEWLKYFAPMRQIADIWPTVTGDPLRYPIFDPTFVVDATTQVAETAAYSEQDVTFDSVSFGAWKNANFIKISRELLQDNILGDGLIGLVSKGIGSMIGRAQAYFFEVGSGSGCQTGLQTAIVALQGNVPVETDATLSFDAVIDLEYAVDRVYQPGTQFFGSMKTLALLRKLKDGQGRYLWDTLLDPIHNVLVETIHGKRYNVLESMSDFAASGGSAYMLCCDPKLFIIREAGPLEIQVNPYLYMGNGQIAIFADQRTDSNYVGPARSCAYLAC